MGTGEGSEGCVFSLLGVLFFLGRGALKSWTRVPMIRGSYIGSSLCFVKGNGRKSGACWLFLRLINNVDIGFLRNGSPFLAFGFSVLLVVCVSEGSSVVNRVPAGRRPVGAAEFWNSVGVLKEDVALVFLKNCGDGRKGRLFEVNAG